MKTPLIRLTAACLAIAWIAPADSLRFAPEPGSVLSRHFNHSVDLELIEMRMVVDGTEMDSSMLGMEMTMANSLEYTWQDTIHGIEGNRPTSLTRVYSQIKGTVQSSQSNNVQGAQDMTAVSTSKLANETILFTWDPITEALVPGYPEDSKADPKLLGGLVEDTDLRGFLPPGSVQVGLEWDVEPSQLHNILTPGGDLHLLAAEELAAAASGSQISPTASFHDLFGEVRGEITCTYIGSREVDQETLQVIEVAIDVRSSSDITEFLNAQSGGSVKDKPDASMDFESAQVEVAIEGEGLLLWDAKAAHFRSFELDADLKQDMETVLMIDSLEGELHIDQQMSMSGSLTISLDTTRQ